MRLGEGEDEVLVKYMYDPVYHAEVTLVGMLCAWIGGMIEVLTKEMK